MKVTVWRDNDSFSSKFVAKPENLAYTTVDVKTATAMMLQDVSQPRIWYAANMKYKACDESFFSSCNHQQSTAFYCTAVIASKQVESAQLGQRQSGTNDCMYERMS